MLAQLMRISSGTEMKIGVERKYSNQKITRQEYSNVY